MRTLLICHREAGLDSQGLARWLASFSHLAGMIVLEETGKHRWRRARRELKRVGLLRFLDVLAFRLYYKLLLSRNHRAWEKKELETLARRYPQFPRELPVLHTSSPNSPEARQFIQGLRPDILLARCKVILKEEIFSLPTRGTFVLHPGICPEYRNAHGCFWALAERDLRKVGLTLLRIDKGVDTGPVFGYFTYPYDERRESHLVIQHRVLLENLEAVQRKLQEIHDGQAAPLDTSGRPSRAWGQPSLTRYLAWKRAARKNGALRATSLLYHDVVEKNEGDSSGFPGPLAAPYKLSPEDFNRHLRALAGVLPGPPATIHDLLNEPAPRAPFFLTFDDGGASSFTRIADALESRGWRGHFFITVDRIGRPAFLTAAQIRQLRRRGHVIGSHSCSHPERMSLLPWERLLKEWSRSVEELAGILGEPVIAASVPGGFYSRKVAAAAARAGLKALFTSEPATRCRQVDGCLVLGRYTIWRGMPPEAAAAFAAGELPPRLKQFLLWNSKKLFKLLGGRAYLKTRRVLLGER